MPLNQTYRLDATYAARPEAAANGHAFRRWAKLAGVAPGRYYDVALALAACDFGDRLVCELGARCSYFGAYLTGWAAHVHVSDVCEKWDYLGGFDRWRSRWAATALSPERLTCDLQDATHTIYRDAAFDVVASFSTIEHVADPEAMAREMGRVCKPGGMVLLSTDVAPEPRRGFFTEAELGSRIVAPSGCTPIDGPAFDWDGADKMQHRDGFPFTCAFLALEKPR